jgi:hypothetical protein
MDVSDRSRASPTRARAQRADVTFRAVEDSLSYPRARDGRILTWFDPALALHQP